MDNQTQTNQAPQAVSSPAPSVTPSTFPSISQLFQDSWQTFIHSILQLFLLNIAGVAIGISMAALGVLIFIISVAGTSFLQKGAFPNLFTSPQTVIVTAIIILVFAIVAIIVSSVLQISSILIVDNPGQTSLIGNFKKSLGLIIPLFLVGILTFFLTVGAFFVLILPALLFYFLLAFVQFEVILNNQRGTDALKRSVTIVSKHFGAILIRLILLFLIYLGYIIITNLLIKIGPDVAIMVGILSFIINLLLGWFSLAYTITLYKQARSGLEQEPGKGIAWMMWIVAILGWLIAVALGFVTYKTIGYIK